MFRLGELFCGPGGLAWGATHADIGRPGFGIVHAWANDYDRSTCDTHIYHWSEPRALTNRERARLQTFPDDYVFEGSKEQVRKQIGMAVPCRGAKVIFEAVLKTFAGVDYDSVPCSLTE